MCQAFCNCFKLLMQLTASALAFALDRLGSKRTAMMAMMAITTNTSIKVNPVSLWRYSFTVVQTVHNAITHAV